MGGYAKTCASWASTGEPDTILPGMFQNCFTGGFILTC